MLLTMRGFNISTLSSGCLERPEFPSGCLRLNAPAKTPSKMNELQKLLFKSANVRGQTVVLHEELRAAIKAQQLPLAAERLAGEVVSAALLAAGALQLDGDVLLQIDGDGPVRMVVAEVRKDFSFRVMVKMRDDAGDIDPNATLAELVNVSNRGRCAFILDTAGRTRGRQLYQGVVPLVGEDFSNSLESYFAQSEQVETIIRLAADDEAAGGIMLQKMPASGGMLPEDFDEEGWDRLKIFCASVKSKELLTLHAEDINRRLFWEESPLVTMSAKPRFACSCSRERFVNIVRSLGREEAESIMNEMGKIEIACRFCGKKHVFEKEEIEAIMNSAPLADA